MPKTKTIFKYDVPYPVYWFDRYFDPEKGPYSIDTVNEGIPPYHMIPLDGGPIGPVPERPQRRPTRAGRLEPEPRTAEEFRKAAATAGTLIPPPKRPKAKVEEEEEEEEIVETSEEEKDELLEGWTDEEVEELKAVSGVAKPKKKVKVSGKQ